MVLFKSQEQTQNLIRVKFTFHYGSIQMKSAWTNLLTGISIYIPLWFYSNDDDVGRYTAET